MDLSVLCAPFHLLGPGRPARPGSLSPKAEQDQRLMSVSLTALGFLSMQYACRGSTRFLSLPVYLWAHRAVSETEAGAGSHSLVNLTRVLSFSHYTWAPVGLTWGGDESRALGELEVHAPPGAPPGSAGLRNE